MVIALPLATPRAGGAEPTPITVTVTPASGLDDGQEVVVNVKTSADFPLYEMRVQQCRDGVEYKPNDNVPNADFKAGGPNCPSAPVTSSADLALAEDGIGDDAKSPAGFNLAFRVGSGVIAWGPSGGPQQTLTCDPDHTCALVVEVYGGPGPRWYPFATTLHFGAVDPIAGCGGPADGIVSTTASDRFSDAWVNWTIDQCKVTPGVGARSRAVFAGEGEGVASFTAGLSDLVYTGLGYRDQAGFAPNVANRRPAANIPVSVNAVVLAVAGGAGLGGKRPPYTDLRLTTDELAVLVSGGSLGVGGLKPDPNGSKTYQQEIEANNAELAVGGMFDASQTMKVGAASERSTVAYLVSRFLTTLDPVKFKVPDFQPFSPDQGKDRTVDASFATALPSYAAAIELFSGRPVLKKTLTTLTRSSSGGLWILTDLATARAFHLTVVKLQNSDGKVVEPTEASMRAAVAKMTPDPNGILDPAPTMTATGSDVVPYPLTYVEYALAPAQPLVAPDCTLRTASQDNLDTWLRYITGPGQATLPAGMLRVDGKLAGEAQTGLAEVGQSDVTGKCAGLTGPTTTTTTPTTSTTTAPTATTTAATGGSTTGGTTTGGGSTGGSTGSSGSSGSSSSSRRPASNASNTPVVPISSDQQQVEAGDPTDPKIPDFSGARAITATRALVALLGIVLVSSIATIVTATSGDDPRRRGGGSLPPEAK
jgi:hypothetical protein